MTNSVALRVVQRAMLANNVNGKKNEEKVHQVLRTPLPPAPPGVMTTISKVRDQCCGRLTLTLLVLWWFEARLWSRRNTCRERVGTGRATFIVVSFGSDPTCRKRLYLHNR